MVGRPRESRGTPVFCICGFCFWKGKMMEAQAYCEKFSFRLLGITARHTSAVGALPMRHQAPFDRMLATQALTDLPA
jgi:hypothetical protein